MRQRTARPALPIGPVTDKDQAGNYYTKQGYHYTPTQSSTMAEAGNLKLNRYIGS